MQYTLWVAASQECAGLRRKTGALTVGSIVIGQTGATHLLRAQVHKHPKAIITYCNVMQNKRIQTSIANFHEFNVSPPCGSCNLLFTRRSIVYSFSPPSFDSFHALVHGEGWDPSNEMEGSSSEWPQTWCEMIVNIKHHPQLQVSRLNFDIHARSVNVSPAADLLEEWMVTG